MALYRGTSARRTMLISGGGIAGLTLAYWLHQHGLQPTIVEQAPKLRPEGYAIDFGGSGWDVAERMQLIPELRRRENSVPYVIFKDGAGRTLARLPPRQALAPDSGRGDGSAGRGSRSARRRACQSGHPGSVGLEPTAAKPRRTCGTAGDRFCLAAGGR
jgi:hypothetical protein